VIPVRTVVQTVIIAMLATPGLLWSQEEQSLETKIKIGVLDLEVNGGTKKLGQEANLAMANAVKEVGFYEIQTQPQIESAFRKIGKEWPKYCNDPRCVLAVGASAQLDRIIYGVLDKNGKTYGVSLKLLDVMRKETIESVELASEAGVSLEEFLGAAVDRLHGTDDTDITLTKYFGREIHNEREGLIAGGAFLAAGILWGVISGSMKGIDGEPSWEQEDLSGIVSRDYHVPLTGRPAALGHAYTALSDDAYGVFYNPAGIAWVGGREAALAYQYRYGMSNLTASYVNKATREIGVGGGLIYTKDDSDLMTTATWYTSVSYKFHQLLSFLPPFSAGLSIKMTSVKNGGGSSSEEEIFSADNQEGNEFGFGFDFGLRMRLSEEIMGAIVLKDIPSVFSAKNKTQGYSYSEMSPMVLLYGGSFQAGHNTLLLAEGQIPLYDDQPWKGALGIEQTMFRIFKGRIGVRKIIQAEEETPWIVTAGCGIDITLQKKMCKFVIVDAAYEFNQLEMFSNVLNFSFIYGF